MHLPIKLCTAVALVCVASSGALADFKKIRKEADFRNAIVGKSVVADNSTVVIAADGTLKGTTADGKKIVGAWNWQGRFWCRNVVVDGKELGTNCQQFEIDGTAVRVTRDKGRGDVVNAVLR